jgi:hypothetical protein
MQPAADQPSASRRLTVQEAAAQLSVTVEAIRGRIKTGTLRSIKDEDGSVYVFLTNGNQPPGQSNSQSQPVGNQPELVEVLQEQNEYLRHQLEIWQEEARRKDAILMAMAQRIPELEASPEPPGGARDGHEMAWETSM